MESIKVGDMIILKGFNNKLDIAPVGIVTEIPNHSHYKIEWVNKELADRWAVNKLISKDRIEKLG